jgi:CRP-like cAMP-binding protein
VPKSDNQRSFANAVLSQLSSADFQSLNPHLESIQLPVHMHLEGRNLHIQAVYFPECGLASVVANGNTRPVEVGVIGREGMTGLSIFFGVDRSPNETFMQVAGNGWRMNADIFRRCLDESSSLRSLVGAKMHVFTVQMGQTAAANGKANIEERLSRWLLMAQDRLGGDHMPLSHEFLGLMLGVRRAGVTVALQHLTERKLITTRRRDIYISDRKGLVEAANSCYGVAEAEQRRVARKMPNGTS